MAYQRESNTLASTKDGFALFWQRWLPEGDPRRVFVLQHGFGEHSGRYGNVLKAFENEQVAFYALDCRGHGQSGGIRGHVDQFQQYVDDLGDLIQIARKENGKTKVYLLGHSLGGLISLQYALEGANQENLKALLLSSPALRIEMDFEKNVKKFVGDVLASLLPSVTVEANLDVENLSHDRAVVEAYQNDPLVHGRVSFQMAKNTFALGEALLAKAGALKTPLYIWHGTADRLVSPDGSRALFDAVQFEDKSLKMYEGLFHETMNEAGDDKWKVLDDLKRWVNAH